MKSISSLPLLGPEKLGSVWKITPVSNLCPYWPRDVNEFMKSNSRLQYTPQLGPEKLMII